MENCVTGIAAAVNTPIGHVPVVGLVSSPLSECETAVELVLIQTSSLF